MIFCIRKNLRRNCIMAKEWVLNSATNRFQLNFKRNVGATSEEIRKCEPKTLEEWRTYYFSKVRSEEEIIKLGKKLYIKITEVLTAEIDEITEEDCINYIKELVIDRTYDGYVREIKTIYGQLQELLDTRIYPAPDKWDRLYNVDFYIEINRRYIGLQIKPVLHPYAIPEIYKEQELQLKTHEKFKELYGGKVFYIYSYKSDNKKVIANTEIVEKIRKEMARLNAENKI